MVERERNYYRLMLGAKSAHAETCFAENFVGVDFIGDIDLTNKLPSTMRQFNEAYRPVWLEQNPGKTKVSAGLSCGFLFTACKEMQQGDIVLCPDGLGAYRVAEITGDYQFVPGGILPHRRSVRWMEKALDRSEMSESLRRSASSIGTVCNITKYASEIAPLLTTEHASGLIAVDDTVEDPSVFALEKHLEEFLVQNWHHTELGRHYDIFEDENGTGQQYPTDTGPIDILAVSKDKKSLLVVELKKGRASDRVVGQIQRYMGYVLDELADDRQEIRGAIIALEDNLSIRRALRVTKNIDFYRYEVSFRLLSAESPR